MRELSFVGLSDDGSHLVLSATDGTRFTVPVDQRLSLAARRDRSRLGQLEIEMDGGLSPKDIQARIRAGMSAEEVAAASGLPLDKVQRFEGAVLAERAYVAEKAAATTVRTPGGSDVLGEVVTERLAGRGINPASIRWDAWRREDGRWVVFLGYGDPGDERSATWTYDSVARAVVPADDEARRLLDDRSASVPEPEPEQVRQGMRLVPVPDDDDLEVIDEALDEVDLDEVLHHDTDLPFDQEAPAEHHEHTVVVEPMPDEPAPRPAKPRPAAKPAASGSRKGRPAVPSWDEILFGTKKTD